MQGEQKPKSSRKVASSDELADLIQRTAAGDKSSFAKLYGLTHRKLYGVALHFAKSRSAASDLLQDSYLKIWRNAHSYDPKIASPVAWMTSIVRNRAIDMMRRQQLPVVEDAEQMHDIAADDNDPAHEIDMSRKRALAYAAFREIREDRLRMIVFAYLQNQSREQIARRFGMPVNTIKTLLRRALLEVREKLEQQTRCCC